MSSKNSDKNIGVLKELEKTISPVLVVNNSSLKPYVELFNYSPENIYQQPLGSLIGFFEIKEYSQDSAYIVNFLTSVLKKEYYINPKRPVAESLDSALHKVNLALSEVAKQGNVDWLGKLHASICVLEQNNAHFSVAGNAKIFLYRNKALNEITEDLASDALEPHPLKTFVNVSSGRLEKDDRLLITSDDIFHILSASDLKKNFQRFEGDKFVQFLKTALSNQLEMIASIVVEMTQAEAPAPAKTTVPKKAIGTSNVFSQQAFANPPIKTTATSDDLPPTKDENGAAYTDEKTGHIYIQGELSAHGEVSKTSLYLDAVKEKTAETWYLTKNEIRRRFSLYRNKRAKLAQLRKIERKERKKLALEEAKLREEEAAIAKIQLQQQMELERTAALELEKIQLAEKEEARLLKKQQEDADKKLSEHPLEPEKELSFKEKLALAVVEDMPEVDELIAPQKTAAHEAQPQSRFKEKLRSALKEQQRSAVIDLKAAKKQALSAQQEAPSDSQPALDEVLAPTGKVPITINNELPLSPISEMMRKTKSLACEICKKTLTQTRRALVTTFAAAQEKFHKTNSPHPSVNTKAANLAPHFARISNAFSHFTAKQKAYTAAALAMVFVVPLFIVHFMDKPKPDPIVQPQQVPPTLSESLSGEKNISFNPEKQIALSSPGVVSVLMTNGGIVAVAKNAVTLLSGGQQKEYSLPADSGAAVNATFMKDLSLVLILTSSGKLISFSPTSLKFIDNNISLSGNPAAKFIGTYLTYLYVLDPAANQVDRYPRADGGFGEKTSWYKEKISLAQAAGMAIDDNIYVIESGQILKFFKGLSQPLTLEASKTPVHFTSIFTTVDSTSLYALDNQSARIVEYGKDGNIIAQYFDEELKNGTSLSVDEKSKTAYVATSTNLISISLQ